MSDLEKIKVNEKDKPFILALIASGINILEIGLTAIGYFFQGPESALGSNGFEMLKFTFPLTMTAWTYYFGSKK